MENLASYAHLLNRVDKCVVLDLGARYTKCGLIGKQQPQHILPTQLLTAQGKQLSLATPTEGNAQEWHEALEIFLRECLLTRMGLTKGFKVICLDSLVLALPVRQALADVLIHRFQASSIRFLLAEATALFGVSQSITQLRTSGLIVDVGFRDCRVLPVYEGVALVGKLQQNGVGSSDVLQRLRALLRECAVVRNVTPEASRQIIEGITQSWTTLEDILLQACYVCMAAFHSSQESPVLQYSEHKRSCFSEPVAKGDDDASQSSVASSTQRKEEDQRVPAFTYITADGAQVEVGGFIRAHAADILFENSEEYPSIAAKILDALMQSEVDMRVELARSIVLSGGMISLPGFRARLAEELQRMVQNEKYQPLQALAGHFYFPTSSAPAFCLPWTGGQFSPLLLLFVRTDLTRGVGSLVGSLQNSGILITSEEYGEKAELPKWNTKILL